MPFHFCVHLFGICIVSQSYSTVLVHPYTPYPDIIKFLECAVEDKWVRGFCLAKYPFEVPQFREAQWINTVNPPEIIGSLRSATEHLHDRLLCHNHINLSNIMLNSKLWSIFIYCTQFPPIIPEGDKLLKIGKPDRVDNPLDVSVWKNDTDALRKLYYSCTQKSNRVLRFTGSNARKATLLCHCSNLVSTTSETR